MAPKLASVTTRPQVDPYHADTLQPTWTQVWIDLESHKYGISQEWDDNTTPEPEWNGRIRTEALKARPDEDAATHYLSTGAVPLVQRVLNGSNIVWDGDNLVGHSNEDADAAFQELINALEELPYSDWEIWSCADWLGETTPSDLGISGHTTDTEIRQIASDLELEASENHAILGDEAVHYLLHLRNELRDAEDLPLDK